MANTWIWHWLPFRPSNTVYSRFSYDYLPKVDCSEYERYRTAEDVKSNPPAMGPNPLYIEWRFDLPGMFVCDVANDIHWSVDKYGRVVIPGQLVPHVVARTLPEFLTRASMESSIWWAVVSNDMEKLARCEGTDPELLWDALLPVLSEGQQAYLRPYYEAAKIWCAARKYVPQ